MTLLDRDVRAAVLRSVAVLSGLTYLGPVDDRAGRPGIGVALTHQGVRTTLLFDQNTGVLLASERAVPGFVLGDYSLYHLFERRRPAAHGAAAHSLIRNPAHPIAGRCHPGTRSVPEGDDDDNRHHDDAAHGGTRVTLHPVALAKEGVL